jgi:uncharacterized damage-inducible protein DinB
MVERIEPQLASDEFTTLSQFLDYYRATLLIKVEGLTNDQARVRGCPPSTLSLMGLVRHMADVERSWFRRVLTGEEAAPIFYTQADIDADMNPSPLDTLDEAVTALINEIEVANRNVAGLPLDQLATLGRDDVYPNLRWIMVHMIEEYARHCGHADLLRESIDGTTDD